MSNERATTLFFDVMSGLPRQGPGDAASTSRALYAVPGVGRHTRVLDIGCGSGAQTRTLLECSAARVVAVDNYPPFIEQLTRDAKHDGFTDRLDAIVADMRALAFPTASFDLIWSEGAIYNVGFENGLRDWHRLLVSHGHLVVTEVSWTTSDPPEECAAFWRQEYPAIAGVPELLETIDRCGYDCIAQFPMPHSAWWDSYYQPLQQNVAAFRDRHPNDAEATLVADAIQREIDIWHAYKDAYAYQFFVMRAR